MPSGKENASSKLVSVRVRKDLLLHLEKLGEEHGLPWQTVWQNLTVWALAEAEAGRGPTTEGMAKKSQRGRPKKVEEAPLSKPPVEVPAKPLAAEDYDLDALMALVK